MSRSVKLRSPCERHGVEGYSSCELLGGWVQGIAAMAQAMLELSTPAARAELARRGGRRAAWIPGQPLGQADWADAGGVDGGWVSREGWASAGARGCEMGWADASGKRRELGRDEGGWAWCPVDGAWTMQIFVMESPSGSFQRGAPIKISETRSQPAALTLWQWDRDSIDDAPPMELSTGLVLSMARSMRSPGIAKLMEGMRGRFEPESGLMGELAAVFERAELDESVSRGSKGGGPARV